MNKQQEYDPIIKSYLKFQTPKENRGNVIVYFLIFLDALGLLPIVAVPFSHDFFIAALIPIVVIHLWALLYVIAPYKFEQSYYLFFGFYGLVNTYVFFLTTQKLLYRNIGAEGPWPFIMGAIFFIGLIIGANGLNIKALYSGTYARLQKKGTKANLSPVVAASGLGYVIAQLILTYIYSESVRMMIFVLLISILSILTAFFSIYIHRYFFILKNHDMVKQMYPQFGLPKKIRN
ncbi:hypothetical protein [Peribacillus sp. NPDC096540]|uniref:hypothetical protein n=1 Tax=Peribacillus sp. NPDC096540 TaxID=3390612 RepID=UPI003CFF510C